MSKRSLLSIFALSCLLVLTANCKPKAETDTTPQVEAPTPAPEPAKPPVEVQDRTVKPEPKVETKPLPPSVAELQRQVRTIYFALDKSDLTAEARSTLQANAALLKANSEIDVVVEGHCDDRGTIEYNMALGERRANAARDYLSTLGIARSRIRVRSWGEERPAVRGSGESAWSKNRRAEFTLE